jgi:acyl-CoA synthetase
MGQPTDQWRQIADPVVARAYREAGWWSDRMLVDDVRDLARDQPDRPAFITPTHRLTWSAYDVASDRLAGVLAAGDEAPGGRVAVVLPDTPGVHVALLAAEKAGLTIVGVGHRAGEQELAHLLARTEATTLISSSTLAGRPVADVVASLRSEGCPIGRRIEIPEFEVDLRAPILVDDEASDAAYLDVRACDERRTRPDDRWLLNSTSGTTGLPKCVVHTQNRWRYFNKLAAANAELSSADIFLCALPAPYGFGIWTGHTTPCYLGAPTVLPGRFSAGAVLDLIERERVSVLSCVSTQFIMLLNADDLEGRDLSSLRVMFTGGEAIPYERAVEFERRTGAKVLQFYGSNETGLLSGTCLDDPPEQRMRTAGRAVAEMEVRLFDNGEDVTATGYGQPGCRGPATSMGYYNDPPANAQLYTTDGWMLMGDLCTLDDEGWIAVVGRTSDFIIRGGKNISAPQVEAEVQTHPSVALAAAVAQPDPIFGERVCCYVQLRPGFHLALEDLSAHLLARGVGKELLPESLILLDPLPISSGGKVAKGDLRADMARRVADGTLRV